MFFCYVLDFGKIICEGTRNGKTKQKVIEAYLVLEGLNVKIKNLNVSYGSIKAIRNIDININSGETVCLIGSNGAGKSSLLNAISMLISYEGTIVFKDKEIKQYTTTQLVSQVWLWCLKEDVFSVN